MLKSNQTKVLRGVCAVWSKNSVTRILEYIFKQTNKSKIRSVKTLKTKIFCIGWFSKIILKSIIKNVQNFAEKQICRRFRDEITSAGKIEFDAEYERKKLVLEDQRVFFFRIKPLFMVNYNTCDLKNSTYMMCWTHGFYSIANI